MFSEEVMGTSWESVERAVAVGRKNALFFLIEDLVKENHSSLARTKVVHKQKAARDVFFIKLETVVDEAVFSENDYYCSDVHISVDKYYYSNKMDFTCAHYTEEYTQANSNDVIVLHFYINAEGYGVGIQAKKKNGKDVILTKEQKKKLERNASVAIKLINQLIEEKGSRLCALFKETELLEREIDVKSRQLITHKDLQAFIKLADEFSLKIDGINRYRDDTVDCRGQFILASVEKLIQTVKFSNERKSESVACAEEDPEPSVGKQEESNKTPEPLKNSKASKMESKARLLSEFFASERAFDKVCKRVSSEIDVFMQQHDAAMRLNDALLAVFFNSEIPESKKRELSKTASKKINVIVQQLPKLYKKALVDGNVAEVKKLFEKFGDGSLESYRDALENHLFLNDDLHTKRIEVCEFLFQNSQKYRSFSVTARKHYVQLYHNRPPMSLLWAAYVAFPGPSMLSMLLRHGFEPNSFGMEGSHRKANLIKSILLSRCFPVEHEVGAIRELLKGGAILNQPITGLKSTDLSFRSFQIKQDHVSVDSKKSVHLKEYSGYTTFAEECFNSVATDSDLTTAYLNGKSEIVRILSEHSTLANLALTLAVASEAMNLAENAAAQRPGVYCAETKEEMDKMVSSPDPSIATDCIQFVMSPLQVNSNPKYVDITHFLCEQFSERCRRNPNEIQSAINTLERASQSKPVKHSPIEKSHYRACLFLYAELGRPLSCMEAQAAIRFGCQYASKVPSPQDAFSYRQALRYCQKSSHAAILVKTPIVSFALEKAKSALEQVDKSVASQTATMAAPLLFHSSKNMVEHKASTETLQGKPKRKS